MLLIWLYLAWIILLIGSAVAFYSQHAQQITRERITPPCARIDELTGLAIMYKVARQFDQTGGGTSINEMESRLSVGPEVTARLIEKMIKYKLVVESGPEANCLIPARSLDHIPLAELYKALRAEQTSLPSSLQKDKVLHDFMGKTEEAVNQALEGQTVADWIRGEQPVGGKAA